MHTTHPSTPQKTARHTVDVEAHVGAVNDAGLVGVCDFLPRENRSGGRTHVR